MSGKGRCAAATDDSSGATSGEWLGRHDPCLHGRVHYPHPARGEAAADPTEQLSREDAVIPSGIDQGEGRVRLLLHQRHAGSGGRAA